MASLLIWYITLTNILLTKNRFIMKNEITEETKLTYEMAGALVALKLKRIFSYSYLIFILFAVLSLLGKFDYLGDKMIGSNENLNLSDVLRIVLIIILLIHWYFGAIYFPSRYRRYIITIAKGEFTQKYPDWDMSSMRGYFAGAISVVLFLLNFREIELLTTTLLWVAPLIIISLISKTDKMFHEKTVKVNRKIIVGTLVGEVEADKIPNFYDNIKYLIAKNERDRRIKNMVVETYCRKQVNNHQVEKAREKEKELAEEKADILSAQIAEKIKG